MISNWIRARTRTLGAIGIGTITWALAFWAAWRWWPEPAVPASGDRIAYGLQLAAAPAIIVLLMTIACLRLFDTAGAEDPSRGAETPRFRINQRVLSNTIEQSWIFVPLLLALAVRLPAEQFRLLPVAVTLWCVGRLMFWAGYHLAPHWRAPGFDWTFWTSVLLAGRFVYGLA